jgi:hypothetical protein
VRDGVKRPPQSVISIRLWVRRKKSNIKIKRWPISDVDVASLWSYSSHRTLQRTLFWSNPAQKLRTGSPSSSSAKRNVLCAHESISARSTRSAFKWMTVVSVWLGAVGSGSGMRAGHNFVLAVTHTTTNRPSTSDIPKSHESTITAR